MQTTVTFAWVLQEPVSSASLSAPTLTLSPVYSKQNSWRPLLAVCLVGFRSRHFLTWVPAPAASRCPHPRPLCPPSLQASAPGLSGHCVLCDLCPCSGNTQLPRCSLILPSLPKVKCWSPAEVPALPSLFVFNPPLSLFRCSASSRRWCFCPVSLTGFYSFQRRDFVWSPTHSGCLDCACLEPIRFSQSMHTWLCARVRERDRCRSQVGRVLLHSDEKPQSLEGKLYEDTALTVWFCLLRGRTCQLLVPRKEGMSGDRMKSVKSCGFIGVRRSVVWFIWFRIIFVLFLVVVVLFSC